MTNISLSIIDLDIKGNIWLVLFGIEKSKSANFTIPYIENFNGKIKQFTLNEEIFSKLTDIEKEIALLLFEEIRISEISKLKFKSPHTIKSHIQKIFKKAGAKNRLDFQRKILSK